MTSEMAGAGVEVAFALFRRLFPLGPPDPSEPPLSDEERKFYRRWEMASLVPLFLFIASLTYPWYLAMECAAGLWHRPTPQTRFLIRPDPHWWFVPAFFLGIISSGIPMFGLYRLLLGGRYKRYDRACAERVGFNARPVVILLAATFLLGTAVFFYFLAGNFARFTDSGVEIGRPLPFLGRSFAYEQVRAIEHRAAIRSSNGNLIPRPHHVILFDDGTSWSTENLFRPGPEEEEKLVRLVSRRSGRAVVEPP
jgi:hypothetical protein